ncbi:hypothetical protein BC939DRAFT_445677 [Gamsiella multidivaricata]|uniref:uncharacterized protein n=1 Tax=Gamsiella multidivaricata TaxID=101098 RepID=UPI00221E6772|nr:uncharacterized protein BC939DRAFT_445677 [Gamsiella multidivaricata]KAI7827069.1 hypothetical protein BC939DRAFT_445677 [Gamsiella multidivaricata]
MPSPAPTPSYLQSLILLQQYQLQQRQLQQQQQQQLHTPFGHASVPHPHQAFTQLSQLSEQQLFFSTQKLKHQQQQQWSTNSSLQSTSALSPTLTESASGPSSPQHLSTMNSRHSEVSSDSSLSSDTAASPTASYYKRRTSATFRSSFSVPSLPPFEPFDFAPDDFLSQEADDGDDENEQEQQHRDEGQASGSEEDEYAHGRSSPILASSPVISANSKKRCMVADTLGRSKEGHAILAAHASSGRRANDADDTGNTRDQIESQNGEERVPQGDCHGKKNE